MFAESVWEQMATRTRDASLILMIKPQRVQERCTSEPFISPTENLPWLRLMAGFAAGQSCVHNSARKHGVTVYKLLANRGRARQRGVWCAHAINLSSLGVHIKLVKSAVEIMVLCRRGSCPVAAVAHHFQMEGRKWLEGGGSKRQTPARLKTNNLTAHPHTTHQPQQQKTVKTTKKPKQHLFLFPVGTDPTGRPEPTCCRNKDAVRTARGVPVTGQTPHVLTRR